MKSKFILLLLMIVIGLMVCGCDTGNTSNETKNSNDNTEQLRPINGENGGNTTTTTIGNGGDNSNGDNTGTTTTTSTTTTTIPKAVDISVASLSNYLSKLTSNKYYTIQITDNNPDLNAIYDALKSNSEICLYLDLSLCTDLSKIESLAFSNCNGLLGCTLPESITSIGYGAFSGCSNLTNITIPFVGKSKELTKASEESLFGYIFGTDNYSSGIMTTQYYSKNSYEIYTMPKQLHYVTVLSGDLLYGAFSGCESLLNITLCDEVKVIDDYAFKGCKSLSRVTIPDSVNRIGEGAFNACSSLEIMILPFVGETLIPITSGGSGDVSVLFGYIFGGEKYNDGTLTKQSTNRSTYISYIPDSLKSVTIHDGHICQGAFSNCIYLEEVTLPENLVYIGNYAFNQCSSLVDIIIPNSVKYIWDYAFYGCSKLNKIVIPESVINIASNAFYGCSELINIIIPESVTTIGDYAFGNCAELVSVRVGSGVSEIGNGVFVNSNNLTNISVDSSNAVFDSRDNCNAIIETSTNSLKIGCKNTIIPNSVEIIYGRAFSMCNGLTNIVIPEGVTNIYYKAFSNCSNLTSVTLPNSLSYIESSVFDSCENLFTLIVNAITPPNSRILDSCTSLTTIYVPADSVEIYKAADGWKDYADKIQAIAE